MLITNKLKFVSTYGDRIWNPHVRYPRIAFEPFLKRIIFLKICSMVLVKDVKIIISQKLPILSICVVRFQNPHVWNFFQTYFEESLKRINFWKFANIANFMKKVRIFISQKLQFLSSCNVQVCNPYAELSF